ncbi:MAG: hypothetical protein ACT6Q9_09670 [Polaromonas sp.]|uniref:hypothetical protein n=1 Tax=Polaromonas sp. TaxID=1869339 RepID=UPI0040373E4B
MRAAYEDRVVLFLDILGFKNLINQDRQDIVAEALSATTAQYSNKFETSAFSDNVAVSLKLADGCELLQIIQFSSYLSWLLLHKGVLSRGGISVGKLCHKNGIIYGPALITAYELESQVAIYPRVVLEHGAISNFLEIHGDRKCVCENAIRQQLRKDFDDWQHVHLMGHTATIPLDEMLPASARAANGDIDHHALIEAKVKTARAALSNTKHTDVRSLSKHQWMTRYIDHYENAFHHAPTFGRLEDAVFMLSGISQTTSEQIAPAFKRQPSDSQE